MNKLYVSSLIVALLAYRPVFAENRCKFSTLNVGEYFVLYVETPATNFALSFEKKFIIHDSMKDDRNSIEQFFDTPFGKVGHSVNFNRVRGAGQFTISSVFMSLPFSPFERFVNCDIASGLDNRRRR